jgi:hypothetical protein
MENLFKNFDFTSIVKTLVLLPVILSLLVILILYLIDILKNRNLSYLNICLKVIGCYYAVIVASLASLLIIRLKYGDIIILKISQSDIFSGLIIFFVSTLFLLLLYFFIILLKYVLQKMSLINNKNVSINSILNPITYFIFTFIFITSLFLILNYSRLNTPKIKNNIQKTTPIRTTE